MGTVESDHTLKCQRFLEVPSYRPHPNPVEPLGPVRGTGPSTPEGEGLNFAIF
jgi:hypothetical protein